ncbi:PAAR domain-containing protein [Acinetobacter gerneri]|uniref:PAAR domain-containing protein n=1 Tax=Acinetobacter gerneri TaxID=202952 RepID=UPI0028A83C9B|nr:PAAR domain-containing protein [Acinetobacter gerneri]
MKAMGVDGSTTSHGGVVKATQDTTKTDGKAWLREGDGFVCPKCKIWSTLIRNNITVSVHGKKAAVVGDTFTCGATLSQTQSMTWVDSESIPDLINLMGLTSNGNPPINNRS